MQITKRDDLASNITLPELGKAMAELDLSAVPPHKRRIAVVDHLVHIMIGTIKDPVRRDELAATWLTRKINL